MKRISLLLTFAITILMVVSCTNQKPYTIEDSGKSITLSNDSEFDVQLITNASTGYQWQVLPFDSDVIKQVGEPEYAPKDDRIGSSTVVTYKFKAIGDGSTKLVMEYRRPWEADKAASKVFEMSVAVGTMGRLEEL